VKEKLLKLTLAAAKLAAAVAAGVIIAVLILPISPAPESRAAFESWETRQTHQEGRGGTQTRRDEQRAVGVPKSLSEEDLVRAREEFFHSQVFESSYRSRSALDQAGEPMIAAFWKIPGFRRACDKATLHAWLFAMSDGLPQDTPANACVRENLRFMVASQEFCEASDAATRPGWCGDIGFHRAAKEASK
jgi:hypothetical protein